MVKTEQARIRRLQDTLIIAGDGVIAFSVWSLVKTALTIVLFDQEFLREAFSLSDDVSMASFYAVTIFFLCLDLGVRLFVGLSARAEGHGKKRGAFYLVVAVLAALLNASSALIAAFGQVYTFSLLDKVVTVAIEATAVAALVLVVCCSVRLRQLNRAAG